MAYGLHDGLIDERYAKPFLTKGFGGNIRAYLSTLFIQSKNLIACW